MGLSRYPAAAEQAEVAIALGGTAAVAKHSLREELRSEEPEARLREALGHWAAVRRPTPAVTPRRAAARSETHGAGGAPGGSGLAPAVAVALSVSEPPQLVHWESLSSLPAVLRRRPHCSHPGGLLPALPTTRERARLGSPPAYYCHWHHPGLPSLLPGETAGRRRAHAQGTAEIAADWRDRSFLSTLTGCAGASRASDSRSSLSTGVGPGRQTRAEDCRAGRRGGSSGFWISSGGRGVGPRG